MYDAPATPRQLELIAKLSRRLRQDEPSVSMTFGVAGRYIRLLVRHVRARTRIAGAMK